MLGLELAHILLVWIKGTSKASGNVTPPAGKVGTIWEYVSSVLQSTQHRSPRAQGPMSLEGRPLPVTHGDLGRFLDWGRFLEWGELSTTHISKEAKEEHSGQYLPHQSLGRLWNKSSCKAFQGTHRTRRLGTANVNLAWAQPTQVPHKTGWWAVWVMGKPHIPYSVTTAKPLMQSPTVFL